MLPISVMHRSFKFYSISITAALLLCLILPSFASADHKKNILILNSYHQGYKWTDDEVGGIKSALLPVANDYNFYLEYMGTKWAGDAQYIAQLRDIYAIKYEKINFDLIFATDNDAFDFLRHYRDHIFGKAPVVFCGVNWFNPEDLRGHSLYTGVNEDVDIRATLDIMLKLHPNTKKIYVITDSTSTGLIIQHKIRELTPLYRNVAALQPIENMQMGKILDKMAKLPEDSLVLLTTYQHDKSGSFFEYNDSAKMISEKSTVPVYGVWDFSLGYGIVGGMLTSGFAQGYSAGGLGLRILEGEKADSIPVIMRSPNKFMFDYNQMERFGITFSSLPNDTVIINQPPSVYEIHKGLAWGVLVIAASLAAIWGISAISNRRRKIAEEAVRQSEEKYRSLVTNLNMGVYRNTIGKGQFIQANPAMAKMFGYTIDELMATLAVDLYQNPEDRIGFIDEVRRNGAVKDKELALKKKDGKPIWCSVSVTAQFDEKNEIRWMDGVIEDITERKNIQDALRRSKEELESRVRERTADLSAANEELRKLAAHLQHVREEERMKVAREIHDELGQSLMALKMDVSWLCSKFEDQQSIVQKKDSILLLMDDTIKSVKRICTELRPGILDSFGIVAAIEWQAGEFQRRSGISCSVEINNDDLSVESESATAIFRIFQEALTNIARHAEATEIKVRLGQSNGNLVLSVIDNGRGISEEDTLKTNSFGLLGMRERVHSLGGTLEINGVPGQGTSITVKLPRISKI